MTFFKPQNSTIHSTARRILCIMAAIFSCVLFSYLQGAAEGYIHLENFSRKDYKGGAQNWGFTCDDIGRIYVANQKGLLIFDGRMWHIGYLNNYSAIRSLLYDNKSGRLYVAGSEEFGYFFHNTTSGILEYNCLSDKIDSKSRFFTEIWKIYNYKGAIWYQSDHHLFSMNGTTLISYPVDGRISTSSHIGDYIYVGLEDGDVLRFDGKHYTSLLGANKTGRKISGIMQGADHKRLLIATSTDGLYLYEDGNYRPYILPFSDYLKENRIFTTTQSGSTYIFGTVDGGAVIHDFSKQETTYLNKRLGLINNTILSSYIDSSGDIWLGLDNGLAFACYNTRISDLIRPDENIGAGYASLRIGRDLYLGTNQGLYSMRIDENGKIASHEKVAQLIKGQVWSLANIRNTLFVSSDAGLYYLSPAGQYVHIEGLPGTICTVAVPGKPDYIIASTYDGFHLLHLQNNVWTDTGAIQGYNDIGGKFIFDNDNNIWISHFRKGVYRLTLAPDMKSFRQTKLFTYDNGLPDNQDNSITLYNGRPIFLTNYGVYRLSDDKNHIEQYPELINTFGTSAVKSFFSFEDGVSLWGGTNRMNFATKSPDGKMTLDTAGLKMPTQGFMPGYNHISRFAHHKFIISNQEGFWFLDTEKRLNPSREVKPFVSMVYAAKDSIVYEAPFKPTNSVDLKLPFNFNSLRFIFAYPDYAAGNDVLFSVMLENYDDDWSQYSDMSIREYTHLKEGKYTLHIRAKDIRTDSVSESAFTFTILPPWYRTTLAYVIYSLIILGAIIFVIWYARRWVAKSRQKAIKQKEIELEEVRATAMQESLEKNLEIANLKSEQLENDIRHKSQQLSDTTMNLIHKNEILQNISAKIESLQSSSAASQAPPMMIRQLKQLQKSIQDDISKQDDWKTFSRNFDIVYGDFTSKLTELHPNLTVADKRMCCYIKMGLSSKEIAPLINISYKSVEMARYRLRKKMNLPGTTSLQDYLSTLPNS